MTDHHQHNRAVLKVLFYRVGEEIASFQAVDVHENAPLPAPNKVLINPIRHISCGVISAVADKYLLHSGRSALCRPFYLNSLHSSADPQWTMSRSFTTTTLSRSAAEAVAA